MLRKATPPGNPIGGIAMLGLVAAYFLVALWGAETANLRYTPTTLIWPASGVALALVLLRGPGVWPLILVATIAAAAPSILTASGPDADYAVLAGSTLLIGISAVIEPVLAAWLIWRFTGEEYLERAIGYLTATLVAVPIAAVIATLPLILGALLADLVTVRHWLGLVTTWHAAAVSNVMGLVVLAPPIWLWLRAPDPRLGARRTLELIGLGGVAAAAFLLGSPVTYLLFAAHLAMTVRLPLKWAAAAVAVSSGVVFALGGLDPELLAEPSALGVYPAFLEALSFVFVLNVATYVTALLWGETEEHRARLEARVAERTRELSEARDRLEHLARTDALTGTWNRRHFENRSLRELQRALRSNEPVGVFQIDVDHFKSINDRYGHAVGDAVLKAVVARLEHVLRPTDVLARIGGEEFAVFLPECDEMYARQVAERLRHAVAATPVVVDDTRIAVTVSVGAAVIRPGADIQPASSSRILREAMRAADRRLYRAKRTGRNRIAGPWV